MFTLKTFYRSNEWEALIERLKLERLVDEQIICNHCGLPIIKKYDCIGHHKIELNDANVNDYNISLNPDNIELIHFKCHNKIHQRFEGFKQKVYIVYGSPCSGKSTWVRENANDDDLIIDVDRIWECISFSDREHKSGRLKKNMFGVRDCLLDQVKTRTGMWRNAFVIGGYPLSSERKRLADLLGAELIFIDTDKETCLSRCPNDEWKEFVNDWFDCYIPPVV